MIKVIKTALDGVVIIKPKVCGDARGYFFESFSERDFNEAMTPILGHGIKFVQDNESMSSYGVMRGLHFQPKHDLLKDFDSPFSIDMNLYPEFE